MKGGQPRNRDWPFVAESPPRFLKIPEDAWQMLLILIETTDRVVVLG